MPSSRIEPLTSSELARLNSDRWRNGYRILLAPVSNRAVQLGLMREALERVRQLREDRRVYDLGIELYGALSLVYGEAGRGGASIWRLHPMSADAAAAGARLAFKYAEPEISHDVLWGPHGGLLRTRWSPGQPSTLPTRLLVWAALHQEAVQEHAAACGGIEAVINELDRDLLRSWITLINDAELALLARCSRLSVPSPARIAAAEHYPASVWDRTLDLLDRGMARGQALLATG